MMDSSSSSAQPAEGVTVVIHVDFIDVVTQMIDFPQ